MDLLVRAVAVAAALAACGGTPSLQAGAAAPRSSPVVDHAVAAMLDDWHAAAARADEETYFAHFAEGAVFLGTDATERWTVPELRAYAHSRFAAGKGWRFRSVRRAVTFVGGVAWFDEDLETERLGPARGSGIVVRDARGIWKIAQYDLSIPIPNERFEAVKALLDASR